MPDAPARQSLFPACTASPAETKKLGACLAETLAPGDVVALYGDLGAGKTMLVKGLCAALGIDEQTVTSPTFTLLHEYAAPNFPIYHFDAYRIAHPDEFYELGYEDYFYSDGLCLIEWPERAEALLPAEALRLHLKHEGPTRRRIELMRAGEKGRKQ